MKPFVNTQFLIDLRDALTKDKLTNYESILLRTKITLPIMEHAIKITTFLTSTMQTTHLSQASGIDRLERKEKEKQLLGLIQ